MLNTSIRVVHRVPPVLANHVHLRSRGNVGPGSTLSANAMESRRESRILSFISQGSSANFSSSGYISSSQSLSPPASNSTDSSSTSSMSSFTPGEPKNKTHPWQKETTRSRRSKAGRKLFQSSSHPPSVSDPQTTLQVNISEQSRKAVRGLIAERILRTGQTPEEWQEKKSSDGSKNGGVVGGGAVTEGHRLSGAIAKRRRKKGKSIIEIVLRPRKNSKPLGPLPPTAKHLSDSDKDKGDADVAVGEVERTVSEVDLKEIDRDLPPHLDRSTRKVLGDPGSEEGTPLLPDSEVIELFESLSGEGHAGGVKDEELKRGTLSAVDIKIKKVKPPREAKIARLASGLQRVLFNPGVQHLRDPRTGVYNFDERFSRIPKPEEFAFDRTPQYITASRDDELSGIAKLHQLKFVGSTSTLTQSLSQIYFAMSGMRGVDLSSLTQEFSEERGVFTAGAKLPACLVIRRLPSGIYAVDNDKRLSVNENILSDYGRILEKLLTAESDDFERFLISSPPEAVPESERNEREAYHYIKSKTLLMRSQLDCQDTRLPGTGVFDIKTRACLPIRHDRANYKNNSAYSIHKTHGLTDSFEREYCDLIRSGMLKYNLQARIGDMDGIFVAYHNTVTCFGFQYLPRTELDQRLFGSTEFGDQAFNLSVGILENILQQATETFPDQSVDVVLTRENGDRENGKNLVTAYIQPHTWPPSPNLNQNGSTEESVHAGPKPIRAITVSMQCLVDGERVSDRVEFSNDLAARKKQQLSIEYVISRTTDDEAGRLKATEGRNRSIKKMKNMLALPVPEGKTKAEMYNITDAKRTASQKPLDENQQGETKGQKNGTDDVVILSEIDTDSMATNGKSTHSEEEKMEELGKIEASSMSSSEVEEEYARTEWTEPNGRIKELRRMAKESGRAYRAIQKGWVEEHGVKDKGSWIPTKQQ